MVFFLAKAKQSKGGFTNDAGHPSCIHRGYYQRSFAAATVALVNETIAVGTAVHVSPIAATAAAYILPLCAGLLHPPYTNGVIIARRSKHMWICRIPTYTVNRAGVTRKSLDNIFRGPVPYIDLGEKISRR